MKNNKLHFPRNSGAIFFSCEWTNPKLFHAPMCILESSIPANETMQMVGKSFEIYHYLNMRMHIVWNLMELSQLFSSCRVARKREIERIIFWMSLKGIFITFYDNYNNDSWAPSSGWNFKLCAIFRQNVFYRVVSSAFFSESLNI